MKTSKIIALSLIACLGLVSSIEAGKIGPLVDQASPSHSSGFDGWNLTNVDVKITNLDYVESMTKAFTPSDGTYTTMVDGDTFESDIHETLTASTGVVLVNLHGKNWPVGEPSGIKVIENGAFDATMSHSRPAHCIMTTSYLEGSYLDAATPSQTLCSSDFQTHKRFKLNMLPTMVGADDAYGTGVNLTFNIDTSVDDDWRYMILQKINNYTDKRLDGFKIEVGIVDPTTGIFTPALTAGADIQLSIGTGEDAGGDIWDFDGLATFSHGLFGAETFEVPVPHFPTDGFFDSRTAGFDVNLTATDTIESIGALPNNYAGLPTPNGTITSQFGDWLPSQWAPKGIFYDDDNDPTTDAQLMAFWGDTGAGVYNWMKGDRDNFVEVTPLELATWASDALYSVGTIEDVLNLGLNYIIELGETGFPNDTFTIRITPHASADTTVPGYVTNLPGSLGDLVSSTGTVSISPTPTFTIGADLTLVVADKDLNANPGAVETVDVNVTTSLGGYELITLTEIGDDRGVFTATLSTVSGTVAGADGDDSIVVTEGTVATLSYYDATTSAVVTATTAVAVTPVASSSSTKWYSVNDRVSILFTIFGFLTIGGLIARRRLA